MKKKTINFSFWSKEWDTITNKANSTKEKRNDEKDDVISVRM